MNVLSHKKAVIILFLLCVVLSPAFSSGKKESTISNSTSNVSVTPVNFIGRTLEWLGSRLTIVTQQMCLNVTPFPSALAYYYADDFGMAEAGQDNNNVFLFNLLSRTSNSSENAVSINATSNTTTSRTSKQEKQTFGMVTKIFAALTALEIVFTAVWGYITDKEGSILKQVLVRVLISIAVFLVFACLPFLIEAMKAGFTEAAITITGADESIAKDLRKDSVFHLPEIYLKSCGDILNQMDPSRVGPMNFNIKSNSGFAYGMLISLVYFVARIIAGIMCCLCAIHIVMNIVEVYLMLGLVSVVLPFMVFTPLRMLGEKAINSLFANVLELFVLIVIVLTCVNLSNYGLNNYLNEILGEPTETVLSITATSESGYNTLKDLGLDLTYRDVQYTSQGETTNMSTHSVITIKYSLAKNRQGFIDAQDNQAVGGRSLTVESWYKKFYERTYDKNQLSFTALKRVDPNNEIFKNYRTANHEITELPVADIIELNNIIYGMLKESALEVEVKNTYPLESEDTNNSLMTVHLILSFFILFFSIKFINDSSQITNSLLMGSLWTFGFDGMTMRAMFGRAASFATLPLGLAGKAGQIYASNRIKYAAKANAERSSAQKNRPNNSSQDKKSDSSQGAQTSPGGSDDNA